MSTHATHPTGPATDLRPVRRDPGTRGSDTLEMEHAVSGVLPPIDAPRTGRGPVFGRAAGAGPDCEGGRTRRAGRFTITETDAGYAFNHLSGSAVSGLAWWGLCDTLANQVFGKPADIPDFEAWGAALFWGDAGFHITISPRRQWIYEHLTGLFTSHLIRPYESDRLRLLACTLAVKLPWTGKQP